MIDLDDLEAKARAATPGPWDNHSINGEPIESVWMAAGDVVATWAIKEPRFEFHAPQAREDAAFIAAANPTTVLKLVERVRAAEADAHRIVTESQTGWATAYRNTETLRAIVRDLAAMDLVDDAYELKALQRRAVEASK